MILGRDLSIKGTGARWNTILENLKIINKFKGGITFSSTITAYNVYYYDEFVKFVNDNFTNVLLDISYCYSPGYMSPNVLPDNLKHICVDKITKLQDTFDAGQLPNIQRMPTLSIITNNIVNNNIVPNWNDDMRRKFIAETQRLDTLRGQSFKNTYPEIAGYFGDAFKEP